MKYLTGGGRGGQGGGKDLDIGANHGVIPAFAAASIKAGATNKQVTDIVTKVANSYGVNSIFSVRMHQMKRFVIDGVKEVALRHPTADDLEAGEQKLDECTFEQAEVYAVDVAMSTGDGKPRPGVLRTTVFKRNVFYWR